MAAGQPLAKRLRTLSEAQRALLAARLAAAFGAKDQDTGGEQQLLAFVALGHKAAAIDEITIRKNLAQRLPAHMVPAAVRKVDALPYLPNGKVDVNVLLRLAGDMGDKAPTQGDRVEPRTQLERSLAEIWCEVLQIDEVSVNDDFFELGGDSILSITFVSKATQNGLSFSPNDIFNFPTIAELGTRCTPLETKAISDEDSQFAGEPGDRIPSPAQSVRPLFMVHGGVAISTLLRKHLGPDQPIFMLNAHWAHAEIDRHTTVPQMAHENLQELRSLQPQGPYLLGGYSMGGTIAFEMAQQLIASGDKVDLLVLVDPTCRRAVIDEQPVSSNEASTANVTGSSSFRRWRFKIANHWAQLKELRLHDCSRYIFDEARALFEYRVITPLNRTTAFACNIVGLPVPEKMRMVYVEAVYEFAWKHYEPDAYAGKLMLFRSTEQRGAGPTIWERVAAGELVVEWFGDGHFDFIHDPETKKQWGERLAQLVTNAQRCS